MINKKKKRKNKTLIFRLKHTIYEIVKFEIMYELSSIFITLFY